MLISVLLIGIIKQYTQYIIIRKRAKEHDGIIYAESETPNAAALTFVNKIIIYGKLGSLSKFALLHESYHLKQKKLALLQLIIMAFFTSLLSYSLFFLITIYLSYIMINWKIEQDADLYAFKNATTYEARYPRPKSRIIRFLVWILDSHPPDYIRISEEYRRKNIYYLFLKDIFTA
ncbi:hypothetical protein [Saccharolobus shibatae]|nr:hypothetical protein [Saccharolobus shibatae]